MAVLASRTGHLPNLVKSHSSAYLLTLIKTTTLLPISRFSLRVSWVACKLSGLPMGTDSRNAEVVNAILAGEVVNLESEDDDRKSESDNDKDNDEENEEYHDGDDMINLAFDFALEDTIGVSNGHSIVSLWIAVTSRPRRFTLKCNPIHYTYCQRTARRCETEELWRNHFDPRYLVLFSILKRMFHHSSITAFFNPVHHISSKYFIHN